jgi:hypothetical protein
VLTLATVLLLALAGPAHSYWSASATGPDGRAQAATLTAPSLTTGSVTATSAPLSWTKPFAPTAYALSQSLGTLSGCSATPGVATTGCTATSLTPNTSYTWTLQAYLHSWFRPATQTATTTKQSTTTTLSNLTPTSAATGHSFSATATVAGASGYGTPAGTVTFSLFTSAGCSSGIASYTSATALSAGAATAALQPAVGTYYWRATYTPTDSYNLASTSACSAAITVVNPSQIGLTFYNLSASGYVGPTPTTVTGGLQVLNNDSTYLRTLTSFTVTASFPDTRVPGTAATAVTGAGWTYQSVSHVGSNWVYTFRWTGTVVPWASTSILSFTVAMSSTGPGVESTATATNPFATTATTNGWF